MTSAAAERPAAWNADRRRGAARHEQRDRRRTRALVAAGLTLLVALLAGAVLLLDLSSNATHPGSPNALGIKGAGMDVSGRSA